jgi:hypothetical protein
MQFTKRGYGQKPRLYLSWIVNFIDGISGFWSTQPL